MKSAPLDIRNKSLENRLTDVSEFSRAMIVILGERKKRTFLPFPSHSQLEETTRATFL